MNKEAQDVIIKRASDLTVEYIADLKAQYALTKEANEIVAGMSEEGLNKYAEAQAFGRGIAIGQTMFKEAAYTEVADAVYNQTINAIASVFDVKTAEAIEEGLYAESGDDVAGENEIAETAGNAAAEVLVEAYGGEEAVMANPELQAQVFEEASTIGAQVVQEAQAALAEDGISDDGEAPVDEIPAADPVLEEQAAPIV